MHPPTINDRQMNNWCAICGGGNDQNSNNIYPCIRSINDLILNGLDGRIGECTMLNLWLDRLLDLLIRISSNLMAATAAKGTHYKIIILLKNLMVHNQNGIFCLLFAINHIFIKWKYVPLVAPVSDSDGYLLFLFEILPGGFQDKSV